MTIQLPTLIETWVYIQPALMTLILLLICMAIGYIGIAYVKNAYHSYQWKQRWTGKLFIALAFIIFIIGDAWIHS